jgi:hypothetical protein
VKKLTGNFSELAYDFLTLAVTRRDMTATWQGGEMESIADRLRQWWVGEHVQHESSREVVFLGLAHRQHWTANWTRAASFYVRDHHRWIIGSIIAIAAVIITAMY